MRRPSFQSVLYVLVTLGALGLIGAVVAVASFLRSEEGRDLVAQMDLGLRMANAPGSDALRAIGCSTAVITTLEDLMAASESSFTGEVRGRVEAAGAGGAPVVICQRFLGSGPDCDEIAGTYSEAVGPSRGFLVVNVQGDTKGCDGVYTAAGRPLGAVGPEALKRLLAGGAPETDGLAEVEP